MLSSCNMSILQVPFDTVASVLLFIWYPQVPASFALTSSDERVISVLAEVVCLSALQSTESHFLDNSLRKTSSYFFRWFQKPKRITSKDSSVVVYKLFEDEIVENAKTLLETFNSMKESIKPVKMRSKHLWWTPSAHSKLEKIGGREFSIWTSENVPAYRLEIDVSRYNDVKLEGWRKSAENRWEILLTHSQMVSHSPFCLLAFSGTMFQWDYN